MPVSITVDFLDHITRWYLIRSICVHNLDPKSRGKCGNDYAVLYICNVLLYSVFPGVGSA